MDSKPFIRIGFIVASLCAVLIGGVFVASAAHAADTDQVTDAQQAKIRSNCTQIKGSLSQLHATDALLRVNRGQVYESMVSKLMTPFNARLSAGGFDNKAMTTHTAFYSSSLAAFRSSYIVYEQKLSEALKVDCRQDPVKFYRTVLEARELRKSVHEDVEKLHRTIEDYGVSVGDFLLNYKRLAE